jgi:ribosomal protein L29
MATKRSTIEELRRMRIEDLTKEAFSQGKIVSKMRLDIALGKEKDTARFVKEKKQLARILTVLSGKVNESHSQKDAEKPLTTVSS